MAALLYALVDISDKIKDGTGVPTSMKCKWNQPRKRKLSPRLCQSMVFKKVKVGEVSTKRKLFPENESKKKSNLHKVKPIDLESLCEKLRKCSPHAALLLCDNKSSVSEVNSEENVRLPSLHNVDMMYSDSVDLSSEECLKQFTFYISNLQCSEEDCRTIERLTKGQKVADSWTEARTGRLTSSIFGTVCKQRSQSKPDYIIKSVMNYETVETPATRWGKSHELAARRIYQKNIQKVHPGLKVFNSGLVVTPKYPYLGTSPDGSVICCVKCIDKNGLVEIKCPFKHRFNPLEEACKDPTFCCEMSNGRVQLKRSHSYYYQVQGQLALTGRSWCDFFVWTLKGHSTERIRFDKSFWDQMVQKLNSFYLKAVIPELFSERIKRGKKLY